MKKIIIFILLLANTAFSQTPISGKVVYIINELKTLDHPNPDAKDSKIDEAINKEAKSHEFELKFNKSYSRFSLIEKVQIEEKNSVELIIKKLARSKYTSIFDFFIDKTNNSLIFNYQDGSLVKKEFEILNWELTDESKTIGEYLCFKAIHKKEYTGRDGKPKTKIIVAWYCPAIPFSYGPKEYYGLPGLIIELTEKGTTFYATNIELFETDIKIDLPKGKTISQLEYEQNILSRK